MQLQRRISISLALLLCASFSFGGSHTDSIPVYILKPISVEYRPLSPFIVSTLQLRDIDDFGAFAVGRIDSQEAATFGERAAGLDLLGRLAPEYAEIRFRDYVIPGYDVQARDLPSELRLEDYTGPIGLYVVQFRSPARDEWLTALREAGARAIHYLPENSYLVACSPGVREALATVAGVRHTVVYQPAYKIDPALLAAPERVRVLIQLDQEQPWPAIAEAVARMSLEPSSSTELGPYINLEAVLTLAEVKSLAADPAVIWIEPLRDVAPSDERAAQIVAGNHGTSQATGPGGYRSSFLAGVCSGCLLDATMQGYVVNVVDTGLDRGSSQPVHSDLNGRVQSWKDYASPLCTTNCGESRPSHGNMVAGIIAGDPPIGTGPSLRDDLNFYWGTGISPRSRLRISRIYGPFFEQMTGFGPGALKTITKDAYIAGARFQNQSWNTGGPVTPPSVAYDGFAQAVDFLVRDAYGGSPWTTIRPMFISVSAGNYPYLVPNSLCPTCVASPANAKNAVGIGATTEERVGGSCPSASRPLSTVAQLSARRAHYDVNRWKPDFVAPATRIVSQQTTALNPTFYGACPAGSGGIVAGTSNAYAYGAGTSYAAPHASGVATLFSRYFRHLSGADPSPSMIRAMMVIGAEDMHGGTDDQTGQSIGWVPTSVAGFGRLGMKKVFQTAPPSKFGDEDHSTTPVRRLVPTQTSYTWTMTVVDPTKEIRIAMAYTDYPAALNAASTAVNKVSLYALQGGFVYCDGQPPDSQGYSWRSSACSFPDLNNNIKFLRIKPNSFTGTFQVQVVGVLNAKAVPGLDGSANNQDLAMWVWNAN